MARLFIKTAGLENRILELRLGVNRVGRRPDCDFPIIHPSVSSNHCELTLSNDGVLLRDGGSTNGTFINGDPVTEAWLMPGQEVRFGEVELFVENTEVNVAIPQFDRTSPAPLQPVVLPDGALSCPRHVATHATYKCTNCTELMCNTCVRVMRRKGGLPLFLCVLCSHKCEPIMVVQPKKKKGFLGFLQDTVKLRFKHSAREKPE
jgi:FHA domain